MIAPGRFLTISDAARKYNIPPQALRLAIKSGELNARRVPGIRQPLLLSIDLRRWQYALPLYRGDQAAISPPTNESEAQVASDVRPAEPSALETIVYALAKDQFHWRPGHKRQHATTKIVSALILQGIPIDKNTPRRRLREIEQGFVLAVQWAQLPAARAKVLTSLQKIALGIAMHKFGWTLGAGNQAAITKIKQALARQDVPMDEDTLRRCLQEAERDLKNSFKPKSD